MEPTRERHHTLVDLLDRVLDRGVVLYADIIVSVAGIPLVGISLRAALAGMETMLSYGLIPAGERQIGSGNRAVWEPGKLPSFSGEQLPEEPEPLKTAAGQ